MLMHVNSEQNLSIPDHRPLPERGPNTLGLCVRAVLRKLFASYAHLEQERDDLKRHVAHLEPQAVHLEQERDHWYRRAMSLEQERDNWSYQAVHLEEGRDA